MKATIPTLAALWLGLCLLATAGAVAQESSDKQKAEKGNAREADPIDFERARALLQKRNRGEKLSPDEEAYLRRAQAARRAAGGNADRPQARPAGGRDQVGFKPLTEMTAEDRYQGQDGGLYGQGRNAPPEALQRAAEAVSRQIEPLDAQGKPSKEGRIVLVSISMSNATQEFSTFKRLADADPKKSPQLAVVDCAQGGQAMAEWATPDARPWSVAMSRIADAGLSPEQVQVAWIKLANKLPRGTLEEHGRKLYRDTQNVIQIAKQKFPNLKIAYLGSRIYGGYSGGALNPEPYAYESAFVVRWLIQDQVKGESALNFDPQRGAVKAPLLLWGPYFWADGVRPRKSDQLVWKREDLAGDGTHPSPSGREKVARMLLEFFHTDESAKSWFNKP